MQKSELTRIARALGDPTRFQILQAIAAKDEICCGDIAKKFPVAQATVSHHLKILVDSGLVQVRREGQFGFFRVAPGVMEEFRRALGNALVFAAEKGPRRASRMARRAAVGKQ